MHPYAIIFASYTKEAIDYGSDSGTYEFPTAYMEELLSGH